MKTRQIPRGALLLLLTMFILIATVATSQEPQPAAKPAAKDTAEAHLGRGYNALRQDRYDVAANEFQAALDLDSSLTLRARFPLAVALFEMRKYEEARLQLETVRRAVGNHPNILYYMGRLDLEDRDFASAIQNLNKAAVKPPFPDTAYYLGYAYFKQGDLGAAEKWLKAAAEIDSRDARIPYQLGLVYRKQGREEEAKKVLTLSDELRRRGDTESKLRLQCRQKLEQGPREEAHALCDQLYDPDNAEKLTELGAIYGQHGDLQAALKPLLRAAELAPQSPQMQYNLALTYYGLNRFEEARAPLANAVKRWPDLFQLDALYGAVLLKLGEDVEAYQALHHANQLNPQDSGTASLLYSASLGLAAKTQGARQYGDALRYCEDAAKLRVQEPEPHRRMAEIYVLMGQSGRAAAEQQEADRLSKSVGQLD